MTDTQIKDYLKKYRIDSEEQLAKHIEELKRNTIPNNEIIFPLVDLLNEKLVLLSFFRENSKERGETAYVRTVTPLFLGEMLGKCSSQCFCDGSCKKPQEKKLGGYIKPSVYVNSTRHKAREEGNFHKEIVGDLEGINRPPNTEKIKELSNKNSVEKTEKNKLYCIPTDATNVEVFHLSTKDNGDKTAFIGFKIKNGNFSFVEVPFTRPNYAEKSKIEDKDDTITNSNRGEKETMKHLQGVKESQSVDKAPIFTYCKVNKNALEALSLRALYGHKKYKETDQDWQNFTRVPNALEEYANASFRHALGIGEEDEETHLVAEAWNAVAKLEVFLRDKLNKS